MERIRGRAGQGWVVHLLDLRLALPSQGIEPEKPVYHVSLLTHVIQLSSFYKGYKYPTNFYGLIVTTHCDEQMNEN
jgi:hypothetical protein